MVNTGDMTFINDAGDQVSKTWEPLVQLLLLNSSWDPPKRNDSIYTIARLKIKLNLKIIRVPANGWLFRNSQYKWKQIIAEEYKSVSEIKGLVIFLYIFLWIQNNLFKKTKSTQYADAE